MGRLSDFINLSSFTLYRMEISGYLRWVAGTLTKVAVEYNRRCTRLEPVADRAGRLTGWLASLADDSTIASRFLVTHGIADSLLSVAAVRAEEIVTDIMRRRANQLGSGSCG